MDHAWFGYTVLYCTVRYGWMGWVFGKYLGRARGREGGWVAGGPM